MRVIGKKCPAETSCPGSREEFSEPLKEIFPVFVVSEYIPSLDSTDHHMMKNPGSIKSCCAWHGLINTTLTINNQLNYLRASPYECGTIRIFVTTIFLTRSRLSYKKVLLLYISCYLFQYQCLYHLSLWDSET
jgi:hypothetical protein